MKYFLTLFASIIFLSCGDFSSSLGGIEVGNPSTTTITGQLTDEAVTNLSYLQTSTACVADEAYATDSQGQSDVASVDQSDCIFTITVTTNMAYSISFDLEGSRVATMVFDNNIGGESSSFMLVSQGSDAIDLGFINISNEQARPQHEPSKHNDHDHDGIPDYDDDDDDEDGRPDHEEEDCDQDGFFDDHDHDDDC